MILSAEITYPMNPSLANGILGLFAQIFASSFAIIGTVITATDSREVSVGPE